MSADTAEEQQQTPNLFAITNEHFKSLLFFDFELQENAQIDDITSFLKSSQLINSFYLINSKKILFLYVKEPNDFAKVEEFLKEYKNWKITKKELPYSNFNSSLVTEVTDTQLKRISSDKSKALKQIESQTGLKLKKQKKSFYFSGFIYQFMLLDELFSQLGESSLSAAAGEEKQNDFFEINCDSNLVNYYSQILEKGFEKLKATLNVNSIQVNNVKNLDDACVRVTYKSDCKEKTKLEEQLKTELNTLRTKLKQVSIEFENRKRDMDSFGQIFNKSTCQDAKVSYHKYLNNQIKLLGDEKDLEKLLKANQESIRELYKNDAAIWLVNLQKSDINENNDWLTQAKNNLIYEWKNLPTKNSKSKVNLYFYEADSVEQNTEFLLNPTDENFQLVDCAIPKKMASEDVKEKFKNMLKKSAGEFLNNKVLCFKAPIFLLNKYIINAILPSKEYSQKIYQLKLKELFIKVFQNVEENKQANSAIAIPLLSYCVESLPISVNVFISALLEAITEFEATNLASVCLVSCNTHRRKFLIDEFFAYLKEKSQPAQAGPTPGLSQQKSHNNSQKNIQPQQQVKTVPKKTRDTLEITINNPKDTSIEASASSSRIVEAKREEIKYCFLCQEEKNLKLCPSDKCDLAICEKCFAKHKPKQCQNCHTKFQTNAAPKKEAAKQNSTIYDGTMSVNVIKEPCEGFEKFETYEITFSIPNGVQIDNDREPGKPFEGTTKKVYLPKVNEADHLLDLYDEAFKNGLLFFVGFDKRYQKFKAFIDSRVTLKTSMSQGGVFGYPDKNYIRNTIQLLEELLQQ